MGYITKRTATCLKGICAILIIIHHVYLMLGPLHIGFIDQALEDLGYLTVSVFFFLSGYGLHCSFRNNGRYIEQLLWGRIIPFYIIDVFLITIYIGWRFIVHESVRWLLILKSLIFGETIIHYGWYIQVQLLLYIVFYMIFRYLKTFRIVAVVIWCLIYTLLVHTIGLGAWWYISVFAFPMGIAFDKCQVGIQKAFKHRWNAKAIILSLELLFMYRLSTTAQSGDARIILKIATVLFFVSTLGVLLLKVQIKRGLLEWFGRRSFEIYAMQGIAFGVAELYCCNNPHLRVTLGVTIVILLSCIFKPVTNRIYKLVRERTASTT